MGPNEFDWAGDEALEEASSRGRMISSKEGTRRLQARKTAADYAAIAVAPVLIFLMISSLANFLILVLYRGGFQSRLSWTVMCFTMGIVAVARIAIERDRVYSYGYAAALGLATLLVMSQLVDSFLFCIFILVVVGYLADLIVRDCTLIDDDVDGDEDLVDFEDVDDI